MSDSVQPRRRQPIRLPHPWDSPGKNTGVGCHFLLQFMKVQRESEATQLCLTLCNPMDYSPQVSSVPGISQARILEWVAIPFSWGSSQCRDWTRISCMAGRFCPISKEKSINTLWFIIIFICFFCLARWGRCLPWHWSSNNWKWRSTWHLREEKLLPQVLIQKQNPLLGNGIVIWTVRLTSCSNAEKDCASRKRMVS